MTHGFEVLIFDDLTPAEAKELCAVRRRQQILARVREMQREFDDKIAALWAAAE